MDNKIIDQIIKAIVDFFQKSSAPKAPEATVTPVVSILKPITKEDLLMGRDKQYPAEYTAEISANLDKSVIVFNKIQNAYGKQLKVNSGWRPAAVNASTPGAAAHSKHTEGLACDFSDVDGDLMNWTLNNLDLMKELNVYMEDWRWTPTWTHYQIVPPKSGNRIFIPSAAPALAPNRWAGHYAAKYN